jgi:hypothetical protein
MYTAIGAAGESSEPAVTFSGDQMPFVTAPATSQPLGWRARRSIGNSDRQSAQEQLDFRLASPKAGQDSFLGRLFIWARLPGGRTTPAMLGYAADMVPRALFEVVNHVGGRSLDNTLRCAGPVRSSEWVLLDVRSHMIGGRLGTGDAVMWSEDGIMLGVASQTATLRRVPG